MKKNASDELIFTISHALSETSTNKCKMYTINPRYSMIWFRLEIEYVEMEY